MICMENYEIATGYALATTFGRIATLPLVARNDKLFVIAGLILCHCEPSEAISVFGCFL
jgi:hypothetical protein